jgi:hypothetical protein
MNTPITLNITREDMNRVTFPEGVTWETGITQRKNNTGFTYVNRAGEALKYTIPKTMRYFVYRQFTSEMRVLTEAAIILDVIEDEDLKDTQMMEASIESVNGYDFEIPNLLESDRVTVKKARKFCKRLLRAFTNVKKLSDKELMGETEEDWYELVFITNEAQRNAKLYNSILDNPFLGEYIGRGPDSCGFIIKDGNTRHVYTLKPHLDPYDVCGGAFGDRRDALAALAAYTARREGIKEKIKAYAEPYDVNSDLMKYVNDLVSEKTPSEILDNLMTIWRVQSFVVADD